MSTTQPEADGTRWRVTGQPQATVQSNDMGAAVRGFMVTYQLATGQSGQVFVPGTQFVPDQARQVIAAAAANLAAIANLTSES